MLYHAKDEVAIVLVGTAETENSVVESLPGQGYEHIVELTKGFSPATLSTLKQLGRLPPTSAEADIVCGVVVATQLCAGAGIKRGAGRILVISDGSLVPPPGRDVLDAGIAEQLGSLGISVDIFAVGGWGKDADAAGGSGGVDSSASPRKPDASSLGFRPQLLELARATGGTVSSLESAVELLGSLRARMVAQRSKYRADREWSQGNGACVAYLLTRLASPISRDRRRRRSHPHLCLRLHVRSKGAVAEEDHGAGCHGRQCGRSRPRAARRR